MLAYTYDEALKRELNAAGENYWETYVQEILDLLGARGAPLPLSQLEAQENLAGFKALILGSQSGRRLTEKAKTALNTWVQEGGLLVGFATHGLDNVFGIMRRFTLAQEPDPYSIAARFELWPHPITSGVHPALNYEQKLLILSEFESVSLRDGVELARLYDRDGRDRKEPAISWRSHGKGFAAYFAFDVPKTVWLLHQGRPIQGVSEGQGYSKTSALQVIGENSRKILYADEIAFVLQNMLARVRQPFIYQIPPDGEKVPDALICWGGDEYFGPTELSLKSSDWMKSKGLPYHVNIGVEKTPGKGDGHPMTGAELKHILDNGHEVSLYYMLYDDNNFDITEERIKCQSDLFHRRFGFRPVCTLHYNCSWKGWAEPARWMANAGGKGDNSFGCFPPQPYDHPMRNSPGFGFGQGTGYPFYFWEAYDRGNERIPFIEEPIACYEIGHRGLGTKGRRPDRDARMPQEVHAPIDMAAEYHLLINMFYHQGSVAGFEGAREAIEEALRYIRYRNLSILHMANNQVCEWWFARSQATVNHVAGSDNGISFSCGCGYGAGMIIKLILPDGAAATVLSDGTAVPHLIRREMGASWVYFIVREGEHQVSVRFSRHD